MKNMLLGAVLVTLIGTFLVSWGVWLSHDFAKTEVLRACEVVTARAYPKPGQAREGKYRECYWTIILEHGGLRR